MAEGAVPSFVDESTYMGFLDSCKGKNVLISGCGGGCDVFGAVVPWAKLRTTAKSVTLLNLTFTQLQVLKATAEEVGPAVFKVHPTVKIPTIGDTYYPEALLAKEIGVPVYALAKSVTIETLTKSYELLIAKEFPDQTKNKPDTLILFDGGCDAFLTGEETGLATPVEDMMHIKSVLSLDIPTKRLLAIGANVDCGHGVVQEELDRRLADTAASGTMLFSQLLSLPSADGKKEDTYGAQLYHDVVMKCDPVRTIVQSLVCAALEGHRGLYTPKHLVRRIRENMVPITDQTCTLFGFDLEKVAAEVRYLPAFTPDCGTAKVLRLLAAWEDGRDARRRKK